MRTKMTYELFELKAKEIHNDKYIYYQDYKKSNIKVKITCKECGNTFYQTPNNHLSGKGCLICSRKQKHSTKKKTFTEFEKESSIVHKGKYVYHQDYMNNKTQVTITCPIHGDFYQSPNDHLAGHGCQKCWGEKLSKQQTYTTEEFIELANKKHNNGYEYCSKYKNGAEYIDILCKKCGNVFKQIPYAHLNGQGCPYCGKEKIGNTLRKTFDVFKEEANSVHNGKYKYFDEYINSKTKIKIECPTHGIFYQEPQSHLMGKGCPLCNSSHTENEIRQLLIENEIYFEEQKRFNWLEKQSLDFYLPKYNIGIECQGIQHFKPIDFFGGEKCLIENKNRDERKYKLCKENNIKLLYYANYDYNFPYEVITNKNELINKIYEI